MTRRDFLKIAVTATAGIGLVVLERKINSMLERGLTVDHAIKTLRRWIKNPEVIRQHWQVAEGIERGEIVPDMETLSTEADIRPGYSVITTRIPEWIPVDFKKKKENFPIIAHTVITPKNLGRVWVTDAVEGEIAIPLSGSMPPGQLEVTDDPSQYGYSGMLGGVRTMTNRLDIVTGSQEEIRTVFEGSFEGFHQVPYAFFSPDDIKSDIISDTYLWCIMAETDENILIQTIEPGVRISVKNQVEIMKKTVEGVDCGAPCNYLLCTKGSGNGVLAGEDVFGSPFEMLREGNTRYLNISVA